VAARPAPSGNGSSAKAAASTTIARMQLSLARIGAPRFWGFIVLSLSCRRLRGREEITVPSIHTKTTEVFELRKKSRKNFFDHTSSSELGICHDQKAEKYLKYAQRKCL